MASKWCLALMSLESVRAVALRLVEVCGAPMVYCSADGSVAGETRLSRGLGVVVVGTCCSAGLAVLLGVEQSVEVSVLWCWVGGGFGLSWVCCIAGP
jgi:hypothetical protein